jgi:hypothetical protein
VTGETGLRAVDGLLTGLHEPRSSHLRLLAAFHDAGLLAECYDAAVSHGYLWHEFGDVHLMLPLAWISTQQVKATCSHGLRVRDTSDVQECASVTARRLAARGAISLRRLLTVFVIGL